MRKLFSIAALSAFSLLLAACGGDSFSGGSSDGAGGGGGSTTGTVASLTVGTTALTIPSDGSAPATIVAVAKDSNSATVSGASVTFTATGGATITTTQGTTGSDGSATATLAAGSAAPGSSITVTATDGKVTGSVTVTVSDARKTLTLLTSSPQVPSDNSSPATISAIVKDANNNLLAGVPVLFQVSSGAVSPVQTAAGKAGTPAVAAGTTDANGLAQATVSTPGDPSTRTITVNATAGAATGTLNLNVAGSTLSLTGPNNLVLGNSGDCNVVLSDSSGKGVGNLTLTVSSAKANTLSAASLITDGNGKATFKVTAANAGTDTITVTGLGLTQSISVAVSPQSFNFTAPADKTNVVLGVSQPVTVTLLNNNAPVANQMVTFSTSRGTVSPTTMATDANGHATVNATSTSSGPAIIQATATGVTANLNLNYVAQNPSQVSFQASPAAVAVQAQSTLTAQVRDANNNLVQGATVNFNITTDPTNGSLSGASAQTDAQGRAQVTYTAGNSSSGANGVTVTATVTGAPTATAHLTVGGQAVGLTFGTGATIDDTKGVSIYQVTYTVIATDSHGAAVANAPITASVLPLAYGKGYWGCAPTATVQSQQLLTTTTDTFAYKGQKMCVNEDTDYSSNIASLDPTTPGTCTNLLNNTTITAHQKDYNCSGTLEPGNAASVAPAAGGVTDANGRLDLVITYNRDHAYWLKVRLVASTSVQGTESSVSTDIDLIGTVTDFGNKACGVAVPGAISPYGTATTCANPN